MCCNDKEKYNEDKFINEVRNPASSAEIYLCGNQMAAPSHCPCIYRLIGRNTFSSKYTLFLFFIVT